MDKSCHSFADSSTTTTNSTTTTTSSSTSTTNNTDQFLRHLNKISHKISKPTTRPTFNNHPQPPPQQLHPPPPPPPPLPQLPQQQQQQQQQQQHQPPVYNIKKSDFRDVVQKLTGSPAHERFSAPPPIQPPKPPSSRLQRIRPPPLAQLTHRPPPLLNNAVPIVNPNNNPLLNTSNQRQTTPLSPLPPLPSVHAAAESPISAYMRYLQSTVSPLPSQQTPLAPPQPQHGTTASTSQSAFLFPSSPLPFGCFPSPRSPYPLLSPSLLFSPSTAAQLGFQPFPVSPKMSMPSPAWKDL